MATRGKALTPEVKKVIVSIKHYFDRYSSGDVSFEPSAQRTAEAAGVGIVTVKRIMADYKRDPHLLERPPSVRGRRAHSIDISYQEKVREYIRSVNKNGSYITSEMICDFLLENGVEESFHHSTLTRTLDRWGFEFGKGTRSQHLKEKDHVVAARHRYLRKKRKNRVSGEDIETIHPEVYLDESYVNKNHSNDFIRKKHVLELSRM